MRESEPTRLLRELIALPSINPAFAPGDAVHSGEATVADYLAALAAQCGLDVDLQEVRPGRRNVWITLRARQKATRRIVLAPHIDTVWATEITPALFTPRIVGDRLHGRGACDTKGCVAAMVSCLYQMARDGIRPDHTEIVFIGLIDEEHGQLGSRAVAASNLKADLAIVGEPTRLKVITAHKGDYWLRLITNGRSAHGSTPHLGDNAITRMAAVVQLIETDYARQLGERSHPLLGHPTINTGTISGGTQPNVVADRCEISVDRRMIPGETEASVRKELKSLFAKHRLRVTFDEFKTAPAPSLETDPELPAVQQLLKLARQKAPLGADFFCDAAILAAGGIPSVVFGPGDIAQAHTADEWISIKMLERGQKMLRRYLEEQP